MADIKPIKTIQKLLENEMYLSEEEKLIKNAIQISFRNFQKLYDDFLDSKSRVNIDCHNLLAEIRRKIDLQREELKDEIDKIALAMIEQTKEYEKSFEKNLGKKCDTILAELNLKGKDEEEDLEKKIYSLNEKFRDPNLKLDTIKSLKTNQDAFALKLRKNLNELNQIRENLKTNEFKIDIVFDKNLFGTLNLYELIESGPFNKSQILTYKQSLDLIKLCEFNLNEKWKMIYRGTRYGFGARDFHLKCDGIAKTLTIIKVQGTSLVHIFGGYASIPWDSTSGWRADSDAFLFSLINKHSQPCKIRIDPSRVNYALYMHPKCGPIFGTQYANDIHIGDRANENELNHSNLGANYRHAIYSFGTVEAKEFLAGTFNFLVSEIEVYSLEDNKEDR